jgi:hypothetical protein
LVQLHNPHNKFKEAKMAIRTPTVEIIGERQVRITWSGLLNGDSGAPIDWGNFMDRSAQVKGTFGAGGSVTMEGSNDGSTFNPLSDPRGNGLAITTAKLEQVEDVSYQIRPNVTAGDGTTNLTVVLFARKVI